MKTLGMLMFVGGVILLFGFAQVGCGDEGRDELEGNWDLNEAVIDGKPFLPEEVVKGVKWIIAENKISIVPPDNISKAFPKQELSFTLNPATDPKAIDITNIDGPYKGKTFAGIYKIEGNRLTLCARVDPADKTRPTGFESKDGSGL